jgi:transcriptional regulator with XRE-family HTH domain
MSQLDLAQKAGFARSTLSKIENGLLSPTFEILLKLAHGFDMPISDLLRPEEDRPAMAGRMVVTRDTEHPPLDYDNNRLFPLAPQLKGRAFQTCIVEFTSDTLEDFGPWNSHATEDMLFVLSGRMMFHSEGYQPILLKKGDSVHFDGAMPHACLKASKAPCRCLYVFAES